MSSCGVLVVAGTHGNEVNAPWLLQQWQANPDLINAAGLAVQKVIGNPEALRRRCRYVDRDLNRCFLPEQLEQGAPAWSFSVLGNSCACTARAASSLVLWPSICTAPQLSLIHI